MSNQDWTSKLQDQLAGYQESVSHDLWAGIEQSLAQNNIESGSSNPQTIASESSESTDLHVGSEAKKDARVLHDSSKVQKNARIVYFKRWSAAAAAVALLGIGGSYVYLHQEDVEKAHLQLASHAVSPSHAVSASHVVSASHRHKILHCLFLHLSLSVSHSLPHRSHRKCSCILVSHNRFLFSIPRWILGTSPSAAA